MRPTLEKTLGWLAASCWLLAWFLPVADEYRGWDAFVAAVTGPFRGPFTLAAEEAVPQVFSALTNLGFVLLFAAWLRGMGRPTLFAKLCLLCVLANLYWPVQALRAHAIGGLLAGYYVWLAGFVLLLAVAILNVASARRTSRTPTAGTPA